MVSKNVHYPGLANTSANLCFLNAVLQSLASINELTNYLLRIRKRWAHQLDKIPIVCAVQELLEALNTPQARPTVLRPTGVIQALANSNDISSSIFNSSDQQDAQEFFALLMDAIDLEVKFRESDHLIHIPTGLAVLLSAEQKEARLGFKNTALRNPMQSLMAHRIACATCGFSSVIRHQTADHFSFNVPSAAVCQLEDCLQEYSRLELLDEYICRKCSLIDAERRLKLQINQCTQPAQTSRDKRRLRELKRAILEIDTAIGNDSDMPLDTPTENEIYPILSRATTKQTMFSRPPDALIIHLSRSSYYARGMILKNDCRVTFPEILILDRFTTTPELCRRAEAPISKLAPTRSDPQYVYQLMSVVVHFGSHSSGHYITFRRMRGKAGWYQISDDDVQSCSAREALSANPTILMYQRLGHDNLMVEESG